MPSIDNGSVVINSIILAEQGSAPATPSTGKWRIYTKSGGLYIIDDAGVEIGPIGTPSSEDYVLVREEQNAGTNGGTFTSGAWRTRVINTEVVDTGNNCSISSNQITLLAGTYRYHISAPAQYVASHQIRLYNITDGAIVTGGEGTIENANALNTSNRSFAVGRFTIAGSKAFEVQHYCQTTNNDVGFGTAGNFTKEIYTIAEFWKEL